MPKPTIAQQLLLPDLRLVREEGFKKTKIFFCEKVSDFEVCPKCATKCSSIYDHVNVSIRDEPIRNRHVILNIRKRRFRCKNCKSVFREPVGGIAKRFRTTERFRKAVRQLASSYMNLKSVQRKMKCSAWLVYKAFYQQIELELRKSKNPWPKTIGIDEHSFLRNQRGAKVEFVTVFVDYTNRRMKDVVLGKSIGDLLNSSITDIRGRENVKNVITDLAPTFRSFAKDFFPNARVIADHFHVVKLMHPLIHELRKKVIDDHKIEKKRKNPIVRLLLTYRKKLRYHQRLAIDRFLSLNEELKELYWFQQRLYAFYRIKGYNRARKALYSLLDDMARSKQKKIKSYRQTLFKWRKEILNYFSTNGLNNGRTEGYNCKAKLIPLFPLSSGTF